MTEELSCRPTKSVCALLWPVLCCAAPTLIQAGLAGLGASLALGASFLFSPCNAAFTADVRHLLFIECTCLLGQLKTCVSSAGTDSLAHLLWLAAAGCFGII